MFVNRRRKVVNFELGIEIGKVVFVLSREWDKEKFWVPMWIETWDLRIPRSDALLLATGEQGPMWSLCITRVLQAARAFVIILIFAVIIIDAISLS